MSKNKHKNREFSIDPMEIPVEVETLEELPEVEPIEESPDTEALSEQTISLKMHTKQVLFGRMKIENLGGGDVLVKDLSTNKDTVLFKGDSLQVCKDAMLYSSCFPKVHITYFK